MDSENSLTNASSMFLMLSSSDASDARMASSSLVPPEQPAIPEGYAGLIIPRSGLAARQGISIVNAPGLIDSGYRGEIKVPLINLDPTEVFNYEKGERIAQLVIIATPTITLHNTYELPESSRGAQGFGSSGLS